MTAHILEVVKYFCLALGNTEVYTGGTCKDPLGVEEVCILYSFLLRFEIYSALSLVSWVLWVENPSM